MKKWTLLELWPMFMATPESADDAKAIVDIMVFMTRGASQNMNEACLRLTKSICERMLKNHLHIILNDPNFIHQMIVASRIKNREMYLRISRKLVGLHSDECGKQTIPTLDDQILERIRKKVEECAKLVSDAARESYLNGISVASVTTVIDVDGMLKPE